MAEDKATYTLPKFQEDVLTEFGQHCRKRQNKNAPSVDSQEVEEREEELRRAAREWCENNDIEYEALQKYLVKNSKYFHQYPLILEER